MNNWTKTDKLWATLTPRQKAVAMALMEADNADPESARNVLGAIINRAAQSRQDIGAHVSQPIYQPTIEPTQQARLPRLLKHPEFENLLSWTDRRLAGEEPDPVSGATHFLAHEPVMVALTAKEPNKYRSWPQWTGYDPKTGQYKGVVLRDKSHAFLTPGEESSVPASPLGGVSRFAQPKLDPKATEVGEAPETGKFLRDLSEKLLNQKPEQVDFMNVRSPNLPRANIEASIPFLKQSQDNPFGRKMFADGGKVVKQRGFVVPRAIMSDDSTEWAVPSVLGGDIIDLIKNFGKYGYDTPEAIKYNAGQTFGAVAPVAGFGIARAATKAAGDELGIFGGRLAKTADLDKLRIAEQFEAKGFPPEMIRKGTGWFRGADGEWRFEVDDSKMQYTGPGKKTLSDAMIHDKLYAAYPDLKNMPLNEFENKGFYGLYYNPSSQGGERIETLKGLNPFKSRQTLIHELQHAIQNREGFSTGVDPSFFKRTVDQIDILKEQGGNFITASILRKLFDKGMNEEDAIRKIVEDYGGEVPTVEALTLANKKTVPELDETTNWIYRVLRNAADPMGAYKRTTGEAESMASVNRMDLNEQQRFSRSPLIDEGFPRNEQIIVNNKTGYQKPAVQKASGGSVFDKMKASSEAIQPAAPNLSTNLAPREQEARAFDPTWQDQIGQLLLGDQPSDQWRNVVDTIVGSSGLGRTGIGGSGVGVADLTPAGLAFAGQESARAAEQGDYVTAGLNAAAFVPGVKIAKAFRYPENVRESVLTKPFMEAFRETPTALPEKVTPGAQNYREVILQYDTPSTRFDPKSEEAQKAAADIYAKDREVDFYDKYDEKIPWEKLRKSDRNMLAQAYFDEGHIGNKFADENFFDPIWRSVPNIISYSRLSDISSPTAGKVLHVEDLGSNWARARRDFGTTKREIDPSRQQSGKPAPENPLVDSGEWLDLMLNRIKKEASKKGSGYNYITFTNSAAAKKRVAERPEHLYVPKEDASDIETFYNHDLVEAIERVFGSKPEMVDLRIGGKTYHVPGVRVSSPVKKAEGGSITDKMLQARAQAATQPAAPNLATTIVPKEPELRAYDPTWRDQITTLMLGDNPSPEMRNLVSGITGSEAGLGATGMGLLDVTPAGLAFAGQEGKRAAEEGDYLTAGLNAAAFIPGFKTPLGFMSQGAEIAASKLSPKGTMGQYVSTLLNSGVKPIELRNAGLIDASGNLLVDPNQKATREELAELLQTKLPALEESRFGSDPVKLTPDQMARYDELRRRHTTSDDLRQQEFEEMVRLGEISRASYRPSTKYSQYTIPGGENYREVLLKLPGDDASKAKDAFEKEMQQKYGTSWIRQLNPEEMDRGTAINRAAEGSRHQSSHWPGQPNVVAHLRMSDRTGPNGEKILHLEELQSDWAQQGRKTGFQEKSEEELINNIKSARDAAGSKMNEIEKSISAAQPILNEYQVSKLAKELIASVDEGRPDKFFTSAEQQLAREFLQLRSNISVQNDILQRNREKLPKAPYVQDTSQWTELGLKRALLEAAEGDYDRLIITPGAEQAKRYNLSNVVDSIDVGPSYEGENFKKVIINGKNARYHLYVNPEGKVISTGINSSQFRDKSLDEIVGKDVAKKLMTLEKPAPLKPEDFKIEPFVWPDDGKTYYKVIDKGGYPIDTVRSEELAKSLVLNAVKQSEERPARLSGLELDIGGKGMKDYYDKIVPNQLGKLVKKLDPDAKVENYKLPFENREDLYYSFDDMSRFINDEMLNVTEDDIRRNPELNAQFVDWLYKTKNIPKQNVETLSIPITPKMKEEIMKGLPGFNKGGRVLHRQVGGEAVLPEIVVGDDDLPSAPWSRAGISDEPSETLQSAPWTAPSRSQAFGTGALAGLTANFYDELAGIYGAGVYEYLSGDPEAKKKYDKIVAEEREKQKAASETYPWTSFAGEVIGTIPTMAAIPFSPAARGLSYAQQVIRSALAGTVYGGTAGAGKGTDAESRAEGAALGAGTGLLGGAASPMINKSLSWAYDRTLRPIGTIVQGWMRPDNVTAARVAAAIMQDQQDIAAGKVKGLSLADWQRAKASGEPVTLADLGAGRTQALLRSAANSSPEGRAAIEEVIETRFKNQAERIATDIRHITGSRAEAIKTADQLRSEYDLKRTPMYRAAFAQPNAQVMWSPELEQMAQAPAVQEAIRAALVSGRDEAAKAGFTPLKNPFKLNPQTNRFELQPGQYPNLQFWDAVKKSLDKIGTREGQFWARTLRNKLDDAVPEYGDARGMAAKFFGEDDALEAGRKLAGKKQIVNEELARNLRKLSPEELELFREGYAYDLSERVIKNISETRNLTKAIYNTPGEKERILTIFGQQGADKIQARMALETILDGARQALGNSTTARQLIEAGLAGGAAGALYNGASWESVAGGAAAGAAARRALAAEALQGVRTAAGYVDRGVARRVAELLVSDDPDKIQQGIEMAIKNKKIMGGLTDLANAVLNASFARAGEP